MRQLKDLNLVPKSYYLRKKRIKKRIYFSLLGVLLVAGFTYLVVSPILIKNSLNKRLEILDTTMKEVNSILELERQFNTVKSLVVKREDMAKTLSGQGIDVLTIIDKIESYMPQKMYVVSFKASQEATNPEISLIGTSASEDEIVAFVNYLRNDSYISSVDILSITNTYNVVDTNDNTHAAKISCHFEVKLNINNQNN